MGNSHMATYNNMGKGMQKKTFYAFGVNLLLSFYFIFLCLGLHTLSIFFICIMYLFIFVNFCQFPTSNCTSCVFSLC